MSRVLSTTTQVLLMNKKAAKPLKGSLLFHTFSHCSLFFSSQSTLPETNIAPENQWLQDETHFVLPIFRCKKLVSGSVLYFGGAERLSHLWHTSWRSHGSQKPKKYRMRHRAVHQFGMNLSTKTCQTTSIQYTVHTYSSVCVCVRLCFYGGIKTKRYLFIFNLYIHRDTIQDLDSFLQWFHAFPACVLLPRCLFLRQLLSQLCLLLSQMRVLAMGILDRFTASCETVQNDLTFGSSMILHLHPPWFKGGGVDQAFCNYNLVLSNQNSYRLIGPTQPNFTTNCKPPCRPTYIHTKNPTTTNCLLFLLPR